MSTMQRWQTGTVALVTACLLTACGGGGSGVVAPAPTPTPTPLPVEPGAPALTGNVASDGLNWLNFRRSQLGASVLTRNPVIDSAAQNHSTYQRINNLVTHDEEAGKSGFTGVSAEERLQFTGYVFSGNWAYGEVISASVSSSGVYLAEELITAIYHRFVIFEPRFKEIGAGFATRSDGYTYFTTNFATSNGLGPGIAAGQIATWPVDGQARVARSFMSNFEEPDPVACINEVGYPISVHTNIGVPLATTSFTIRPRGGAELKVRRLIHADVAPPVTNPPQCEPPEGDTHTPVSAAAIVPIAVLAASTTYDVSFVGTVNGLPVSKTWSFTTNP